MKWFRSTRWLPVLAGALMALLGFACTLQPEFLSGVFPLLAGVCVLALGMGLLAFGFTARRAGAEGGPLLLRGAVDAAVGCVLVFNPHVSKIFLGVLLAVWLLAVGVLRARTAWRLRRAGAPWLGTALDALVKCALGAAVGAFPLQGLAAGVVLLGVALLFAGVSVIVCALYVDRTFRDAAHFFDDFDDDSPLL